MSFITKNYFTGSLIAFALLLNSCGDNNSTQNTVQNNLLTPNIQNPVTPDNLVVGKFIDDPVEGLNYTCSSGKFGKTDSTGSYICDIGDDVVFSLGTAIIGTISAQTRAVTPYSFFPDNNDAALNLAQLLQSIDSGKSNSMLIIDPLLESKLPSSIDFTDTSFDENMKIILKKALVTQEDARKTMNGAISFAGGSTSSDLNYIPIADAGSDFYVDTSSEVTLNGSLSSDADTESLTYSWSISSKPEGSNASLENENSSQPSFIADLDGQYIIELTVNDNTTQSAVNSVIVTAMRESIEEKHLHFRNMEHHHDTKNSTKYIDYIKKILTTNMGNDTVIIDDDIGDEIDADYAGNRILNMRAGDDTLQIGDDLQHYAKVNLGLGNDFILVGGEFNDHSSIVSEDGNDTITILGTMSNRSSIDAGAGDDTITLQKVRNASIYAGSGSDSLTIQRLDKGDATIYTNDGNDVVVLKDVSGFYDNGIVDLGDGNDILNIEDTLIDTSSIFNGGAGTDTAVLTNVSKEDWYDRISNIFMNFEFITLSDGTTLDLPLIESTQIYDISLSKLRTSTLYTKDKGDKLSISGTVSDSNISTAGGADNIYIKKLRNSILTTGLGNDLLNIDRMGKGKATIDMGDGDDILNIKNVSGGYDNGSVNLGNGNDILTIDDTLSGTKTIFDGGNGVDKLILTNVSLSRWNAGIKEFFINFENIIIKDNLVILERQTIAPVARIAPISPMLENRAVTFDASSSSDEDGYIVSYEWKEQDTVLSTNVSFSKSDFSIGTHIVTLSITDDTGVVDSTTVNVVINRFEPYTRDRGIVTDKVRNIMWQDDQESVRRNISSAQSYCSALILGGYTDWRVPSKNQLAYIVDTSKPSPKVQNIFENVAGQPYWSSTSNSERISHRTWVSTGWGRGYYAYTYSYRRYFHYVNFQSGRFSSTMHGDNEIKTMCFRYIR